jgi:hypothetical protein
MATEALMNLSIHTIHSPANVLYGSCLNSQMIVCLKKILVCNSVSTNQMPIINFYVCILCIDFFPLNKGHMEAEKKIVLSVMFLGLKTHA